MMPLSLEIVYQWSVKSDVEDTMYMQIAPFLL